MTDTTNTTTDQDNGIEVPGDFWFRTTGLTATLTISLKWAEGEQVTGQASADIDPDKGGEDLAILAAKAAQLLNASSGNHPDPIELDELYAELGLKPPAKEASGG